MIPTLPYDVWYHITSFLPRECLPLVNPSSLYRNLSQLPRLTKLSISHPLERFLSHESTGIDTSLKNNRHTLVELRFHSYHPVAYYPPPPDAFFSHPIFKVAFPLLEVLHLGLYRWSNNSEASVKDNLSRCLASFGNSGSLTKLAILEYVLRLEQLQAILLVVGGENSELRRLQVHLHGLDGNVFEALASQTLLLYELELCFNIMTEGKDDSFNEVMVNRRYPEWSLCHLTTVGPLCFGSIFWDTARGLLTASLPGVISFNGMSRGEFGRIPDYTKTWWATITLVLFSKKKHSFSRLQTPELLRRNDRPISSDITPFRF
ncbi:unnamed protein product [Cyclocybe aegerita]|uniref:F-box domain-containing protein n=1 Tax=Cyclocybe aegerita TaxID=1973307 RepID=A0A8S0VT84_CYCAE|nr:unnamed protein product [Cyclocybe aegerita]